MPPKDWEQLKDEDGVYLIFRGTEDQGFVTMNVKIQKGPNITIEKLAPDIKKGLPDAIQGWKRSESALITGTLANSASRLSPGESTTRP